MTLIVYAYVSHFLNVTFMYSYVYSYGENHLFIEIMIRKKRPGRLVGSVGLLKFRRFLYSAKIRSSFVFAGNNTRVIRN